MTTRRDFLVGSAVSVGLTAPGIFQRMASAAPKANQPGGDQTVLVVVQLTGGNDGLNTVVPFNNPIYQKSRPSLKLAKSAVSKINDDLGLHPGLKPLAELYQDSKVAVVQGVGYPKPNRSHFESMDIWHKANLKPKSQSYGWLGRAVPLSKGTALNIGRGESPLALFGVKGHAPSLTSLEDYRLRVGGGADKRNVIEAFAKNSANDDLLKLVRDSAKETYDSARRLEKVAKGYDTPVSYPQTGLATRLKLIAQLIHAGTPERVFYTQIGGFDTHASQQNAHNNLMSELGGAVGAFVKDVKHHGHGKRVLVVTFSEFGRRIKENGSKGTDHGAASQMFLLGEGVKSGLIGKHPELDKPERGDLKFHTDFRSVYATLLDKWLGVDSKTVLGSRFDHVKMLKKQKA